jgi:serine/threonine protein phosphatase 1
VARHLAIGDIHGCNTALESLIDFVSPSPDDTIVTLGDYVDRGSDSRAVLDLIIDLGRHYTVVPLRGNHEIMMLDAREKKSWLNAWLSYGGDETLRSYASDADDTGSFAQIPDSHIDFLENKLLSHYECPTHFFVHAFADANVALADQSDATLYWRKYQHPEPHCSGKIMVCGHTPQRSGLPANHGHSICIDTWAHGDGWLSCLDTESGKIWQANEAGDKRILSLGELGEESGVRIDPQNS